MTRVTLRLPEELHRRLRAASTRTGSSLNELIVAALNTALSRDHTASRTEHSLQDQIRYVRMALGELALDPDMNHLPAHLRRDEDLPGPDVLRHSLPELVPSLSDTIIADREDRF